MYVCMYSMYVYTYVFMYVCKFSVCNMEKPTWFKLFVTTYRPRLAPMSTTCI